MVVVAAGILLWTCISGRSSSPPVKDLESDAKRVCQDKFIPARLKAPATAKFSHVMVTNEGSSYSVIGSVDSENSFGALVRSSFICMVHDGGSQWILDSASVF